MAGYLIYVPERYGKPDRAVMQSLGLADTLDGGSMPMVNDLIVAGPDEKPGYVLWWDNAGVPDSTPAAGYHAEAQTWKPATKSGALEAGRYWIGWETARPPRPVDLERRKCHPGTLVRLRDGNQWLVPAARQFPQVYGLNDDGVFAGVVEAQYREFYDRAWQYLNLLRGVDKENTCNLGNPAEAWAFSVQALAWNYRINADIATALELLGSVEVFGDETSGGIIRAATDFRALVEFLKKKSLAPASPNM